MDQPTTTAPHLSRTHRRWWNLSLRALMILVLIVGGGLGWQARRASIQRRAVAELKAAGGAVMMTNEMVGENRWIDPHFSPWAPGWLRRVVGDEPFQEVGGIIINGRPEKAAVSDATIAAIASCDRLEMLNIYHKPLTDDQLARFGGLTRLKSVCLLDTKVTIPALERFGRLPNLDSLVFRPDHEEPAAAIIPRVATITRLKHLELNRLKPTLPGDLEPLRDLPNLEHLRIFEAPTDEACLEPIAALSQLKILDLRNTRVTDAGFRRLAGLSHLEQLLIDGRDLTDEGLATLACWPRLQNLHLRDSWEGVVLDPSRPGHVTDRGLASLAVAQELDTLSLVGARITDSGLAVLAKLPRLESLDLVGVDATEAGLRDLLASHQFGSLGLIGPGVADAWTPLLATQTRLASLTLGGPSLTDQAMVGLATLPALDRLNLAGSKVTDAGLLILAQSPAPLRYLDVRNTAVTNVGIAAFQRIKPNTKIQSGPIVPAP